MTSFQTQVNVAQVPAVEGDFASTNPRASVLAGPGGIVAGTAGLTVGRFAWVSSPLDGDGYSSYANNYGFGRAPDGFVRRNQQGLITTYLAQASMVIPAGFPTILMSSGDYWVKNTGTLTAQPGMKAYANFATGVVTFAATATPTSGASATSSSIAAGTGSCTAGTITGNILTVAGTVTPSFYPGGTISGTGVATGTKILSQISGTANGAGTYYVSIGNQTVAATTISETHGVFTAGTTTGAFIIGGTLTGTGITATTTIWSQLTGTTGGAGTYVVDVNTVVSSTTITQASNVETKYTAQSIGAQNELVKISSQALG